MTTNESRRCGRPTKTKSGVCQNTLWGWWQPACKTHWTDADAATANLAKAAWEAGRLLGEEIYAPGIARRDATIARLEAEVKELSGAAAGDDGRYYSIGGEQVVEVGGYSYRWCGEEMLAVGDRVMLPSNWVSEMKHGPGPFPGIVNALGSTYRGGLSAIVRRAD